MVAQGAPLLFSILFCAVIALLHFIGNRFIKTIPANRSKKKYGFIANETLFNNSILVLIAAVVRSDSKVSDKELLYIKKSLSIHFAQDDVQAKLAQVKSLCERKSFEIDSICEVIKSNFHFNEKIQLLHFLIGIVASDGLLTKEERKKIVTISRKIKIPLHSLEGIFRMFNFITEEQVNQRQQQRQQKNKTNSFQLNGAYEVLGLHLNATEKEIKKAYRSLAKLHHPDKLVHLGTAHQQSAKEKFQVISDAYELIKTKKGFN